jgi:hypothetical protein
MIYGIIMMALDKTWESKPACPESMRGAAGRCLSFITTPDRQVRGFFF